MVTGSGTSADPYILYDLSDLEQIPTLGLNKYYKLGNDIDASATQESSYNSGAGWLPIGTSSSAFSGYFDGDNHIIDGLYINRPSTSYIGLFGYVYTIGKYIQNFKLTNINITGDSYVGGVVGQSYKSRNDASPIYTNIYVSGVINANGSYAGGVVGYGAYVQTFTDCIADITITASSNAGGISGFAGYNYRTTRYYAILTHCYTIGSITTSGEYAGGLVGYSQPTISQCYSICDIEGTNYCGGLVGYAYYGTINNSYAMGSVNGATYCGCFIGYASGSTLTNCYSCGLAISASGFCGGSYLGTSAISCYWDTEASGSTSSTLGTGKTTEEMMLEETYVDWDFDTIWDINTQINECYPFLRYFPFFIECNDVGNINSNELFGCDA